MNERLERLKKEKQEYANGEKSFAEYSRGIKCGEQWALNRATWDGIQVFLNSTYSGDFYALHAHTSTPSEDLVRGFRYGVEMVAETVARMEAA